MTRQVRITDYQSNLIEWIENDENHAMIRDLLDEKIRFYLLVECDFWNNIKKNRDYGSLTGHAAEKWKEQKEMAEKLLKLKSLLHDAHQKRPRGRPRLKK